MAIGVGAWHRPQMLRVGMQIQAVQGLLTAAAGGDAAVHGPRQVAVAVAVAIGGAIAAQRLRQQAAVVRAGPFLDAVGMLQALCDPWHLHGCCSASYRSSVTIQMVHAGGSCL